ncbi:LEM-3-like GIY-YIG domain-containing protein [Deinococcus fonticola]|uniref:LEM-3-like GIY-YIG domain-containing protein n=1 Tax=Deinococcus fonticola TaxID=2528713 RepID=UPI001F0F4139|nr:hypothetical protein [Deinococcus fonticola]
MKPTPEFNCNSSESTYIIPPEVAQHLGFYVYLYIDPRNNKVFYVGKGQGGRVLAHLSQTGETRKVRILKELRDDGLQPRIEVLVHGLPDEVTAFRIEAAVIDLLGLDNLSNLVRGWQSVKSGRKTLSELIAYYAAPPAIISDSVMLIRINQNYRHGMSAEELYEVTRGIWKIAEWRRASVKYALAVFESVVREVYEIESWHKAQSTPYTTRSFPPDSGIGRWEFVGHVAPAEIRDRYLNHSVSAYFTKGAQNPIAFPVTKKPVIEHE